MRPELGHRPNGIKGEILVSTPYLDEAWQLFADEAQQALDHAEGVLERVIANTAAADHVDDLFRAFHTCKGNAHLVGLRHLDGAFHELEEVVGSLREAHAAIDQDTAKTLLAAVDAIRQLVEGVVASRADLEPQEAESFKLRYVPRPGETLRPRDVAASAATLAFGVPAVEIFDPPGESPVADGPFAEVDPVAQADFLELAAERIDELRGLFDEDGRCSNVERARWLVDRLGFAASTVRLIPWIEAVAFAGDEPDGGRLLATLRRFEALRADGLGDARAHVQTTPLALSVGRPPEAPGGLELLDDAPVSIGGSFVGAIRRLASNLANADTAEAAAELEAAFDHASRCAEGGGFVQVVEALEGLRRAFANPLEREAAEVALYETLERIEDLEGTLLGLPLRPGDLVQSWCATRVESFLAQLRELAPALEDANARRRAARLFAYTGRACAALDVPGGAEVAAVWADALAREESPPGLRRWVGVALDALSLATDDAGLGESSDAALVRSSLHSALACVTDEAKRDIAGRLSARLGLPPRLLAVLVGEAAARAISALDAGHAAHLLRFDADDDPVFTERFLVWKASADLDFITNSTGYAASRTFFDFLAVGPLDVARLDAQLAALDPSRRKLWRVESYKDALQIDAGPASQTDRSSGVTQRATLVASAEAFEHLAEAHGASARLLRELRDGPLGALCTESRRTGGRVHESLRDAVELVARLEALEEAQGERITQLRRLAIDPSRAVEGLVVACGGFRFVLPLASVERVVQADASDVHGVPGVEGAHLLRLGDETMPVVPLPGSPEGKRGERPLFVVVRAANTRAAVPIEQVLGAEHVVLHPKPRELADLRGISGVTSLADGTAAVVLAGGDAVASFAEA